MFGGRGFVFREVAGRFAITVSREWIAGAGGRGSVTYFFTEDKTYTISTYAIGKGKNDLIKEREVLNDFLKSLKVIE